MTYTQYHLVWYTGIAIGSSNHRVIGRIEIEFCICQNEPESSLIVDIPIVSPISASVTSGENECPPFATRMVCVTGPDVVPVAFADAVDCDDGADVIDEAEADVRVGACAVAATTKAVKAVRRCISSCSRNNADVLGSS